MKELKLAGHKVRLYDSIEELPICRFHAYNRMLLIDAGIGSDINDFDAHRTCSASNNLASASFVDSIELVFLDGCDLFDLVHSDLADLFGVTVDYLMFGKKRGIAIAGNIITDFVKNIDIYPKTGMMSNVSDISYAETVCEERGEICFS